MMKTVFVVHSYCNPYRAFLTREAAALWIYDHERRNDLVIEEVPLGLDDDRIPLKGYVETVGGVTRSVVTEWGTGGELVEPDKEPLKK